MTRWFGIAVTVFILAISPTVTSAQGPGGTPRDRFPGTLTPTSPANNYVSPIVADSQEYGLGPGQALAEIEVKLTVKRDGPPANPQAVVPRAGRAIATARTGSGGGVTFSNVLPGAYVIVFQIVEWATPEVRSNIRKSVIYTSGYEWRAFPDAGYQYAIRAPNLVFTADELRRSRDGMGNRVVTIAQEFELSGPAPVAVRTAIGHIVFAK